MNANCQQTAARKKTPLYHLHHTTVRRDSEKHNIPGVLEIVRCRNGDNFVFTLTHQLSVLGHIDVPHLLCVVTVREDEIVENGIVQHLHLHEQNTRNALYGQELNEDILRGATAVDRFESEKA